ncbi:MAG: hypothetical protein D6786_10690 [Gammaproteobacteria bacterium]|nr:MAG: hypothetical protein D6786_10690 [Gammaproteobacteria bacterium]
MRTILPLLLIAMTRPVMAECTLSGTTAPPTPPALELSSGAIGSWTGEPVAAGMQAPVRRPADPFRPAPETGRRLVASFHDGVRFRPSPGLLEKLMADRSLHIESGLPQVDYVVSYGELPGLREPAATGRHREKARALLFSLMAMGF